MEAQTAPTSAPAASYPAVMLDIESMSTHSSRALILSLGAYPFRLTPEGPEFGPALLIIFDLADQLLACRQISSGTQQFWSRQKPIASEHWADPKYDGRNGVVPLRRSVRDLPDDLKAFFAAHCVAEPEVWSQGVAFDVSNLADTMLENGQEPPWKYFNVSDCRTIRRKLVKRRTQPPGDEGHAALHDPVHDCQFQIWQLWEHATDEMLGLPPLLAPVIADCATAGQP